jgi:hypothetical protein
MTICIGLVCDGGKRILLSADTRASYEALTQNDECGKLFDLPFNFCAAIAGTISWCSEVISELHHQMGKISESDLGPEKINLAIQESYTRAFMLLVEEELRNSFKITRDEYLHDTQIVPSIRSEADEALKRIEIDVDLIVGGFVKGGPILLTAAGGTRVMIRSAVTPGTAVIGTGAMAALNWLNYRKQNAHLGVAHSLLHLTEAKQFAQVDRFISPLRQMVVLWPEGMKPLNGGQELIQEWWNKFGLPLSDGLEKEQYTEAFLRVFDLPKI